MKATQPSYDDVTAWLRENHRVQVVNGTVRDNYWICSCGSTGVYTLIGNAKAGKTRHLRAARARHMKEST